MNKITAQEVIDKLGLIPHIEGGFYKETYRSEETILHNALPARYNGDRRFGTAIYFLLRSGEQHKVHRLKSDEIWHYYLGSPLAIKFFENEAVASEFTLGSDIAAGQVPQLLIPKHSWMVASVIDADSYTLVGCTTAPGFEFDDFEIAGE